MGDGTREIEVLLARLGYDSETPVPHQDDERIAHVRWNSNGDINTFGGVIYAVFAREWREEYDTMIDYAANYQYFASPAFQNTVFLSVYWFGERVRYELAFPDEWVPTMTTDWQIFIIPKSNADIEALPYLRVVPLEKFERETRVELTEGSTGTEMFQRAYEWADTTYGLDMSPFDWDKGFDGLYTSFPQHINYNNRTGEVFMTRDFIVEMSVPQGEEIPAELQAMYNKAVDEMAALNVP